MSEAKIPKSVDLCLEGECSHASFPDCIALAYERGKQQANSELVEALREFATAFIWTMVAMEVQQGARGLQLFMKYGDPIHRLLRNYEGKK